MPTIQLNGTELHYEDEGPRGASTLVFSHSLFFDAHMFHRQVAYFSSSCRVICYDHRGQGRSAPAGADAQDLDTLAADAAALIEALCSTPCHLVGNSLGGFVALRVAARRPELLASCTVLGSSGEAEHKLAEFQPLVDQLREVGGAPLVDTLLHVMFGDHSLADPGFAEELAYWRAHLTRLGPTIGDSAHHVVHRRGILDELKGCSVPLLAIAGEQDHAYNVSLSQRIAEAVLNGRLEVIEQAGHSVALESAARVNALLERHIADAAVRA